MSLAGNDDRRPRLWGLKTGLVATVLGPTIAAFVFLLLLLVHSGGLEVSLAAGGARSLFGLFQFILLTSYLLIVPHVLFIGLIGCIVYLLRHRVDAGAFWQQAQWAVLVYVCTMPITVNAGNITFSHRVLFIVSLGVASGIVWLLTRRWHTPPRHVPPAHRAGPGQADGA